MSRIVPQSESYQAQGGAPRIILTGQQFISSLNGSIYLILTYQPDRSVLTATQFNSWLKQAADGNWGTWEELATAMVEGFYDEVLPFAVTLQLDVAEQQNTTHSITLSRQQPGKK